MKKRLILIIIAIVIIAGYFIYQFVLSPKEEGDVEATFCQIDSDCIVFGQDGDCNCGCFNKNHNWEAGGDCFCAAPKSCKCVEGKCENVFEDKIEILKLMDQISDIIGIDRDPTPTEAMAITVKWNTEEGEEMEYNGIGYGIGDVIGSETIRSQYNSIDDLLKEEGFIIDAYNAMSGFTKRYKKDTIVCNLTKTDHFPKYENELKGATDMQIASAHIENPLIIFEVEGIGGERDQYGCLGPAGYTWDAEVFACIRAWELSDEDQRRAAKMSASSVGWEKGMTILEVKPTGCTGCFTVNLEHGGKRTQTSIENWLVTDMTDLIN